MHVLIQCWFLFGVTFLHFADSDYTNDDQSSCAASFHSGDGQNVALLQVGDQRSTLRASALQASAVDPDKDHRDLMCYLKDKVQESFKKHLEPLADAQPLLYGAKLRHKTRCAAVSSSGSLLKNSYGPRIDGFDVVFRFNEARISGFEDRVGKNENVRVANQFVAEYLATKTMDVTPGASYILLKMSDNAATIASLPQMYPKSAFYVFPWDLWGVAGNIMQDLYSDRWTELGEGRGEIVTTGCIGMLFALSFCESVEAFEMAASDYASSSPYSYYGRDFAGADATDNRVHAFFEAEHDLWKRMSVNSTADIAKTGRALIPGFDAIDCENVSDAPRFTSFLSDSEPPDSSRRVWNLT